MNILTHPSVHVLSVPQFFDHPRYIIPQGGTPSERLIAHAGKGCYDAYGTDGRPLELHIGNLISSGHGSVLEHANVSLFIEGVTRGCSHEIVRHRAGFAYSQRSTRYTNESEASIVLEPYLAALYLKGGEVTMDEAAIINRVIKQADEDFETYNHLVSWLMEEGTHLKGTDRRKWARGKARQSLPHCLETRLTMTGNLRAWRHFIEQRSGAGAEPEIRRLSNVVFDHLVDIAPFVFDDYYGEVHEGYFIYEPKVRKV